jgi:ubiquitin C-terminal hydrolase
MLMTSLELFRSSMHQDAHEFLNFVLNTIAEDVSSYQKKNGSSQKEKSAKSASSNGSVNEPEENGRLNGDTGSEDSSVHTNGSQPATWVHQLFEGVFSNETRCLTCETVSHVFIHGLDKYMHDN